MKVRFLAIVVLAMGLAIGAVGCGDNSGSLVGYRPEGQASRNFLWGAVAVDDTTFTTGSAYGFVYALSPTSGERMYYEPGDQGYRPATDYIATPLRTYSTGWSLYRLRLPGFDPTPGTRLITRGSSDGIESGLSPLSNEVYLPPGSIQDLATLGVVTPVSPAPPPSSPEALPTVPVDSLYFVYSGVPGAVVSIFNLYRGSVPIAVVEFGGADQRVFENLPLVIGASYQWGVDEFDASNRLIGVTIVPGSFIAGPPHEGAANPAAEIRIAQLPASHFQAVVPVLPTARIRATQSWMEDPAR